jgi:hypothetical protein
MYARIALEYFQRLRSMILIFFLEIGAGIFGGFHTINRRLSILQPGRAEKALITTVQSNRIPPYLLEIPKTLANRSEAVKLSPD